jgi:hypothetical protein
MGNMNCTACGHNNPETGKYCIACGASLQNMSTEWAYEHMMGRLGDDPSFLTVVAKGLVTAGNSLLIIPSMVVATPVRLILGLVKNFVPGGVLFLLPFTLLWALILAVLTGTSWLWEKVPPLRLLLIVIGVPLAWFGCILIFMVPDPKEDALAKRALADQWPLTFDLWRQLREKTGN